MSALKSMPPHELLQMVRAVADVKANMPLKQSGVVRKTYGVNIEVTKILDATQYTAGVGKFVPDLRFTIKGSNLFVRSYKPGDWESALRRAYEDLLANRGPFAELSIQVPEHRTEVGQKRHPTRELQVRKKNNILDRFIALFVNPED